MSNHSSLLFGSLTIDLCSNPSCTHSRSAARAQVVTLLRAHSLSLRAYGFYPPATLANDEDSLVRVTRRVRRHSVTRALGGEGASRDCGAARNWSGSNVLSQHAHNSPIPLPHLTSPCRDQAENRIASDIWFEPKQDNLHQPHLFASLIGRVSAEETSALDHFVFKMIVSPAFCPHSSRSFQTVSGTFDSAFAVLFNFRSCYLSTIGLPTIFSFGSMLPAVFDHYSQSSRLSRRVENIGVDCAAASSTGLSPSLAEYSNSLARRCTITVSASLHRSLRPFQCELCPVHSPLLGASQLFSFPPPNEMLQLSG